MQLLLEPDNYFQCEGGYFSEDVSAVTHHSKLSFVYQRKSFIKLFVYY